MNSNYDLNDLSMASLSNLAMAVSGEDSPKKYATKSAAVKKIGKFKTSKQKIVKALLEVGTNVSEISKVLKINELYARDIISKLRKSGVTIDKIKTEDNDYRFKVAK